MTRRRPLSSMVVDRAAHRLGRRVDRRTGVRSTAMAATALVAAPADFVLRPRTAYAAVCGCSGQGCPCGSQCCDGYTEFCCTLTGENGCPPGTVAAGWWKVDGSGFCGGAPRYYLDCNAQCGSCGCSGGLCSGACSGTRCGCAWGNCDLRKTGCTMFRYGQCNQQVACLGPIVCRVVTCTPPWVFDGSCTTQSRTDNNTASHTAPCLEAPFGAFDGITDLGGAVRLVGWAIDQNLRDGVEVRVFLDQRPEVRTMADLPRPDVGAAYPYYGANHGFDVTVDCGPGRHVACVLATDQGSGATKFLAFRSFEVQGPVGAVDGIVAVPGGVDVAGWAFDPLRPGQRARVRVVIDGIPIADGPTWVDRGDVAATVPGAPVTCGYATTAPTSPGPHLVCADLVYESGRTARLGCSEVVV